jgi:Carboxypeptidase regulatory-like domain/TonB dependent receptor
MRCLLGQYFVRLFAAFAALGMGLAFGSTCAIGGTVGSLRGTVTDTDSKAPVAGVSVTLASPSGRYSATTDAHGFYAIEGIRPDTYLLAVSHEGYQDYTESDVTVDQDSRLVVDLGLHKALREIGRVTAQSTSSLVQRHQASDVYAVNPREQTQLTGLPSSPNEAMLLDSLPGVSGVGGGTNGLFGSFPLIRGGLQNDQGYQVDGIDATEPITNEFINNLVFNGSSSVNVTAGPGDASKGGSGSGYVNIVTKTGTYPASGYLQLDAGGYAYQHNASFEFGAASPRGDYSFFLSGRYDRDAGGCCTPPFGNSWGNWSSSNPDTLGQVGFEVTNDTVANLLFHFGRDKANTIQIWNEWGANHIFGSYGIDPATYPYASANPAYVSIYQEAPFFVGGTQPLTPAQAQAIFPFYPGQTAANQPIGAPDQELTNFTLSKIAWSRAVGNHGYVNARLYRTQNSDVDAAPDPNDPVFAYGLPAIGFSEFYVTRATQNTGFATDFQQAIGTQHELSVGFDYRFSNANLSGTLPSPSLFFAGPTISDFLPSNPFSPSGAPGVFYGTRYPAVTETVSDPLYRSSVYVSDNWLPTDRITIVPGLRYDLEKVPTAAGTYEANGLEPRAFGTVQLGKNRDTVLRGGYGHATIFAPLFQIEAIYKPPAQYKNDPATLPICGGTAANFSAPCPNYYDELYNAWWKGYGINPYSFPQAQQSDNYDLSLEHQFPQNISLKLTAYHRRDYDVIVNSQQVTISPTGAVIPGTTAVTNDGRAETNGIEFALARQVPQGLSTQLNLTYINQFVNYLSSNAFRPSVSPALLATGALVHPPYLSPLTGTASFEYNRKGWRINPILQYARGYPTGIWNNSPALVNGKPTFIPNTNLYGNFQGAYCFYADPQDAGTAQSPHIVGSTGGGCNASENGALTAPVLFVNLAISKDINRRVTIGIEGENIFRNIANAPYLNPGYINNGFGAYGPGSGTNPVAFLPGAVSSYGGQPFVNYLSGPASQWTLYGVFRL